MNLKQIRKTKGITQEQMAQLVDVSRGAYTNIETGKRRPSIKVAKKIAIVLGVHWTVFFEEGEDDDAK